MMQRGGREMTGRRKRCESIWAVAVRTIVFVLAICLLSPLPATATQDFSSPLTPGEPISRSLDAGEIHRFQAHLDAGRWILETEQHRVDTIVEVLDPAAQQILRADTFFDGQGIEWIALDIPRDGRYTVGIEGRVGAVASGTYRLVLRRGLENPKALRAADLFTRAAVHTARFKDEAAVEDLETASGLYAEARLAWAQLDDGQREAESLHLLGLAQRELDHREAARATFEAALTAWRTLGDVALEASALNDLALVRRDLGEPQRAELELRQAMDLFERVGDTYSQAIVRFNLCRMRQRQGRLDEAETCFLRVVEPLRLAGASLHLGNVLNSLGGVYYQRGEPLPARRYFAEALQQYRLGGHLEGEASTLNNRASLFRYLGSWRLALTDYEQALELQRRVGDRLGEGRVLNNLGYGHLALGDTEQAAGYLEQALALRRAVDDKAGQAVTLNNLGTLYQLQGNPAKALEFRRWALELREQLGRLRDAALTRIWMARDLRALGRAEDALARLGEATAQLEQLGDRRFLSHGWTDRGRLLMDGGRLMEARDHLHRALALQVELGDVWAEVESRVVLVEVERRLGHGETALEHSRRAMDTLEGLRREVPSPELRAGFLHAKGRVYELAVDVAMDLHRARPGEGWHRLALTFSERGRSRVLLDLLRGDSSSTPESATDVPQEETADTVRQRLHLLEARRLRLGSRADGQPRRDVLAEDMERWTQELHRLQGAAEGAMEPRTVHADAIQRLLDDDMALLEIALGEAQSVAWWVTAEGLESHPLPPRRQLEDLAEEVHRELSGLELGATTEAASGLLRELSEALLGPFSQHLEEHRGRPLWVVPDGALHYVPFTALKHPGTDEPLVCHHPVVHLPSASTLAVWQDRSKMSEQAVESLAVFGDPVFGSDDARWRGATASAAESARVSGATVSRSAWHRLPSSGREARAVAGLAAPRPVELALGFDASLERLQKPTVARADIVHLATHGVIDAGRAESSGLVLSTWTTEGQPKPGFLDLAAIHDLSWQAQLVVLSGCRTAWGKELRGEGLMGLSHGFLRGGARTVVASLWPVDDAATARLMEAFYRGLLHEGRQPADALRRAQLELLASEAYRDPFYWAGFIAHGSGR